MAAKQANLCTKLLFIPEVSLLNEMEFKHFIPPHLCMMGGPFLNNETSFLAKIQLKEISNINQNGACFEFPYVPIAAVITQEKTFILQTVLFVSVLFF